MRFKYQHIPDPQNYKQDPDYFLMKVKRELSREIEKHIEVKTETKDRDETVITGEVVVLPPSQLDHIKGMLTMLRGNGIEKDMVLDSIWSELRS